MAEWSAHRTRNTAVPGSNPALGSVSRKPDNQRARKPVVVYMQDRGFNSFYLISGRKVTGIFEKPPWPLARFVLGRLEFKSSATLVNSQVVASCQLGFEILLCCI